MEMNRRVERHMISHLNLLKSVTSIVADQVNTNRHFISFIHDQWRARESIVDENHVPFDSIGRTLVPFKIQGEMNMSCLNESELDRDRKKP